MDGLTETAEAGDVVSGSLTMGGGTADAMGISGRYAAECFGADGELKWREEFDNLVTSVGKNDVLDKYLAGSAYTASVVMGLKGTGAPAAGDTQASHAGWSEVGGANAPAYSGTRKTPAFSAAAAGVKSTSAAATFTFTSGGTVAGCFINLGGTSAIDNTTGILYSAGDFSASRTVLSGDTLNVSYSATLT